VSVANFYGWGPNFLRSLFLDAEDELGLVLWYREVQEDEKKRKDEEKGIS
jgi:hypothetical protein